MQIVDPSLTKPVDSSLITESEVNTSKIVAGQNLTYFYADRTVLGEDDPKTNYFHDLRLPSSSSDFSSGSTLATLFPELLQLNVDRIIIGNIPGTGATVNSGFSQFIDGRSIEFGFPQYSAGTFSGHLSSATIYSSTYTSDVILKSDTNILLGSQVAFLFCDAINKPYSGYSQNEVEVAIKETALTWAGTNVNNFLTRPAAIPYSSVPQAVYGSDLRTNVNYAYPVPNGFPNNESIPLSATTGQTVYSYDIPVGFINLTSGFVVITHPTLVNNFPLYSAYTSNGSLLPVSAVTANSTVPFENLYIPNDALSYVNYVDIDTEFSQVAVCLAMPSQFYISNNDTWNRELALQQLNEQNGIVSFDPIFITTVGLWNALGQCIAQCKLSAPIEKNYTSLVSVVVNIDM